MGFSYFNPNPAGRQVGDCTVRAISKSTGQSWDETYMGLCLQRPSKMQGNHVQKLRTRCLYF